MRTGAPKLTAFALAIVLAAMDESLASGESGAQGEKGRILFLRNCSECHGLDATGNGPEGQFLAKTPANLRDGKVLSRYTDDEVVGFVRDGKALRIELRPEKLKQHAQETEALYRFIRKLPEVDWEKWEDGEGVYLARCVSCHDYYGRPSTLLPEGVKPPRDLAEPKFQASLTDEELVDRVRHGKKGMPGLVPQLTGAEAKAVVGYVRILSPGYALYDRYCIDCHGMRGEGGTGHLADARAPNFAFDEEFFRKNYADEIRRGIWHMLRDENPSMPHFREALSEAEVKAILAYLRSLPRTRLEPAAALTH